MRKVNKIIKIFVGASFIPLILGLMAAHSNKEAINWHNLPLRPSAKKSLLNNKIYASSDIKTYTLKNKQKRQSMDLKLSGLHPKSCRISLRKISQYQNYKKYIGFVHRSSYNNEKQQISLSLRHILLPFNMHLLFKIPRITSPGYYPFFFERGFLKGLTGIIHVSRHKKRCLFYMTITWDGPDSTISDPIFEFFTEALSHLAMKRLFKL